VIYEQHYDHTVFQCDCCGAIYSGRKAWLAELLKDAKHWCPICMGAKQRFLHAIVEGANLPQGPVRKKRVK
jgi:hypothetical protein